MQRIFLFVGSLFLLFSADLLTGAEVAQVRRTAGARHPQ